MSERGTIVKKIETTKKMEDKLTKKDLFRLLDLYFYRGFANLSHLYNSYDKFIEDVMVFLTRDDHPFHEYYTQTKKYTHGFRFSDVVMELPVLDNEIEPMSPSYARIENKTYAGKFKFTMEQYVSITDTNTDETETKIVGKPEKGIPISVPIMIRSRYCNINNHREIEKSESLYEPGGYFVIKGVDRVIISQDSMAPRHILVFEKKDTSGYSYVCQVNSKPNRAGDVTMQVAKIFINKAGLMTVKVPILNEVNVIVLFRALGIETDSDIVAYSTYDYNDSDAIEVIRKTIGQCKDDEGNPIKTREEALTYLMSKIRKTPPYIETEDKEVLRNQKRMHLISSLETHLLPHVEGSLRDKGYHIGLMVNRLLSVFLGRRRPDDRDSYVNKRVDTPGDLLFELFVHHFGKAIKDARTTFMKSNDDEEDPLNIINQLKISKIEKDIIQAMSTGNWPRNRTGIAQIMQRLSYLQMITYLSRIDVPSSDEGAKIEGPRHVHPSAVPFLCCIQTPENSNIGLNKNKSIIAGVTIFDEDLYHLIKDTITEDVTQVADTLAVDLGKKCKVFLNGELLGFVDKITEYSKKLNSMRDNFQLDRKNVSIVTDYVENEISIYCDAGRLYRPVIKVKDNQPLLTKNQIKAISLNTTDSDKISDWDDFVHIHSDSIDYLDMMAQPYTMVSDHIDNVYIEKEKMINASKLAEKNKTTGKVKNRYDDYFYIKYDCSEIHPSVLLGEIATNIIFADRNQGPRNIFQFSQGKQAMGIYMPDYRRRIETSNIAYHPTRPLITSRTSRYTNTDILPPGEMAIVAIASYTGYNQEDSILLNRNSTEAGLFRACTYKKYTSSVSKNQSTSQDDIFMKPDPTKVIGMRNGSYEKLNDRGYVPEETRIENGDIIIGKVTPIQDVIGSNKNFRDSSESYKSLVPGYVDRVYSDIVNQDGYDTIKMTIRSERLPAIGDKFCFLPDHEILTENGWVPITDVSKDVRVATLVDGERLVYDYPTDTQELHWNGRMYNVQNNQVDLCVTDNHRLYVDIGEGFKIALPTEIYGKSYSYLTGHIDNERSVVYVNNNEQQDYWSDYNGKVYCCTVPSGIIYVRRNGKPVWTGNCSRHGQKGTIGIPFRATDMPFSESGLIPDLIINPNAIPSRMTIGQLVECLLSKTGAMKGVESDGTSMERINLESIEKILRELGLFHLTDSPVFKAKPKQVQKVLEESLVNSGFFHHGFEYMYNGMTGKKMEYKIFVGPTYYQRLKHMVSDKIHGRSRGPRTMLTRQPTEGRSRDGGLRTGEMERDALIAHGASRFLKERMLDNSDAYATYVCGECGLLAQRMRRRENRPYPTEDDIYYCPSCKNFDNISKIVIPYAFKLLLQEMESMHIAPRIRTKQV